MPFFLQSEFPPGTRLNACVTCNTDRRVTDRLIDLGVHIDFEGHLIMCETCAKEIAHLLGYETDDISEQLVQMRRQIHDLEQEKARLELITEAFREAVGA
jgi:hypothetical protein